MRGVPTKYAQMARLLDVRPGEPQEAQRLSFKIARKLQKHKFRGGFVIF